jgi:hypothetical protein
MRFEGLTASIIMVKKFVTKNVGSNLQLKHCDLKHLTPRHIPEDGIFRSHRLDNLKY